MPGTWHMIYCKVPISQWKNRYQPVRIQMGQKELLLFWWSRQLFIGSLWDFKVWVLVVGSWQCRGLKSSKELAYNRCDLSKIVLPLYLLTPLVHLSRVPPTIMRAVKKRQRSSGLKWKARSLQAMAQAIKPRSREVGKAPRASAHPLPAGHSQLQVRNGKEPGTLLGSDWWWNILGQPFNSTSGILIGGVQTL